ncbi:MAG: transcriptional repressor [Candidatus Nealsonbacteria bacterium]
MEKKKDDIEKRERITSQKQVILDYLKKNKNHPCAEKVYLDVRKKLPRISQATVYRILKDFRKKNKVQVISVKGISCFDGDISSHAHFICQSCNKIFDIFDICGKCKILNNKKLKVGKIKNYKICFYGKCKCCEE